MDKVDKPEKPGEYSDPVFLAYAEALRGGDLDECDRIRQVCGHEVQTKIETLERIWLTEMQHYIREMAILERERDGWRKLALAREKKLTGDKGPPTPITLTRHGNNMLAQAEEARLDQPEIVIPRIFGSAK